MSPIQQIVKALAGSADTLVKQADEVVQPAASRFDFSNGVATIKQPDYSKLDAKLKQPNRAYMDAPGFEGTAGEYSDLASRMYDAGSSREEVVSELGVMRSPLNKENYPHVQFEDQDVENIGIARSSGKNKDGTTRIKNESIYEGANTANRRVKSEMNQSITTDEDGNFEYHRFDTNKRKAKLEPGMDLHHKRTIQQYSPFYEGLNDQDAIELTNWFRDEGYPVGNNKANLLPMKESDHMGEGSIHEWMDQHKLNPKSNMKEFKKLAAIFKDLPLNERLPLIVKYLEFIQEAVEEKMGTKSSYSTVQDFLDSLGTIPSGPKKGQRMPRNRRTIGDKIIKDLQSK